MSDDPGLTVIIPAGHCWRTFQHRPHLIGDPPDTRRCDGSPLVIDALAAKPREETPCPSSESTSPGTTPTP